jgi:hypothetical protein
MSANKMIGVSAALGNSRHNASRRESPARLEHETHRVGDDLDDDLHHGPDRELSIVVAPVEQLGVLAVRPERVEQRHALAEEEDQGANVDARVLGPHVDEDHARVKLLDDGVPLVRRSDPLRRIWSTQCK